MVGIHIMTSDPKVSDPGGFRSKSRTPLKDTTKFSLKLISSVFKKIIPNNTTPSFQEVGGVISPSYFVDGIRTSHGIAFTITKLIELYSQGIFTFLFATVFN